MRKSKKSGLSIAATDPVPLKVLSWNVAGLAEDCTDIFLSQISMLTIVNRKWKGQSKIVGVRQEGLRSSWMDS